MKIITSESAGFCFGVERAVALAVDASKDGSLNKISTLGELIHNSYVVEELNSLGIDVIESIEEAKEGQTVVIRSHGVSKKIYDIIRENNIKYIDATCPYVKSIQNKVEKYYKKGYTVIIVGDRDHPEVIGVNGWCGDTAIIVKEPGEAESIKTDSPVCVVAQTTITKALFDEVCGRILTNYPDAVIFDTICSATLAKQEEAGKIAQTADAMIVIGGKHSSNTKRLVELCANHCSNVYHIETADEINKEQFSECEIIGVTAGASTPKQLILEVVRKMDNTMENFEKSLDNLKQIRVGDILTGEIISVNESEVYVNIGYKSDGIIKKADYLMDLYSELTESAAIGDQVKAMVTDMNDGTGNVILSKIKVDEIAAMQEAEEMFKNKETVKGKITKIVKGGLIVDLGFAKAFMPGNQYALRYTEDLNALLGKEVDGRIIEFDMDKNKVIFSRKIILQEQRDAQRAAKEAAKAAAIEPLEVGQLISAPVKNIADFGIFIDMNGVDGFIHVSDLSWKRIAAPKNFCQVGDVIEAKITDLDKESGRIKLSIKALTLEPWQQFLETYKVGDVVEVEIKNIVKFGAFAEIIPMVEGLIHISNLAHDKVPNVESVLRLGEKVNAKIIEIDTEKRNVGLSLKAMSEPPKRKIESDKLYYKEDSTVTMENIFKKYLDE